MPIVVQILSLSLSVVSGSTVPANPDEGRDRQRSGKDVRQHRFHAALEAENVAGVPETLYDQQYVSRVGVTLIFFLFSRFT